MNMKVEQRLKASREHMDVFQGFLVAILLDGAGKDQGVQGDIKNIGDKEDDADFEFEIEGGYDPQGAAVMMVGNLLVCIEDEVSGCKYARLWMQAKTGNSPCKE